MMTVTMISSTTKTPPSTLLSLPSPSQRHQSIKPNITFFTKSRKQVTTAPLKSVTEDKQDQPTSSSTDPDLSEQPDDPKIDSRRLEEKFAVVNTGIYECRSCGYKYDEASGDPSYPIPPGLPFDKLPEDWRCPTCGASQSFFQSKRVEIAGFEQNQQFGFGGNALTSGQKLGLIYGGLFLGFLFFLSGYFLQ